MAFLGIGEDKKKPAQKFTKGGAAAAAGAYLASVIPPDGSAAWEVAVYTGLILTALNVLKHQFGVSLPFLDD